MRANRNRRKRKIWEKSRIDQSLAAKGECANYLFIVSRGAVGEREACAISLGGKADLHPLRPEGNGGKKEPCRWFARKKGMKAANSLSRGKEKEA